MTQEQRAAIRGGCAECPGRAEGYKWAEVTDPGESLIGEAGEEKGHSFCRFLFLISAQSSLTRDGFAAPCEELWHSGQERAKREG